MGWDYDKASKKHGDNWWVAYADLYTMMSMVFLVMYTITSLRTSAESVSNLVENKKLAMEVKDLREQNRVFNTLKDNYLEKNATADERKTYEQLMDKLSLLQDETNQEKRRLRKLADENEEKEAALNQYQRIIRNIINTNLMAKAGLKRRDQKIEEKRQQLATTSRELEQTSQELQHTSQELATTSVALSQKEQELQAKNQEVASLQADIDAKKQQIAENNRAIMDAKSALNDRIAELKSKEHNAKRLNQQIAALKKESAQKISALQGENAKYGNMLNDATGKLSDLSGQLEAAGRAVAAERDAARAAQGEAAAARGQAEEAKGEAAAARAKAAQAERDTKKYKEYLDNLQKEKDDMARDLARSKAELEAKRKLAQNIRQALGKVGVKGEVDGKTGDVLISFGDEYFDTDRASLRPGMVKTLEKFFPAYARTLLEDPKTAKKIDSVEIIGFSSPTFGGKYVDPQSLTDADKAAVNYNLDLSYRRARAIFQHLTDSKKFKFPHQKQLLPLIKVTGRSYLSEGVKGRDLKSGISQEEFCAQFDCKKQQRVIIKFSLKE